MILPEVSVIIRTRNEERWISHCLRRLATQTLCDHEVVLVDNRSADKTVERARAACPTLKLVSVSEFRPGHAINEGIRASSGRYLACLSGHCLPAHDDWLERLRANFADPKLAGVYGRQVPMNFTSDQDKRDLLVTFGLDRRVQHRDPFFHNANSMFAREVWEKFPFREEVTNIEDRLWAKEVLAAGYHIVYEPEAAVFHHHGIHQGNDPLRASNVVRVMEQNGAAEHGYVNPIDPENLDSVAVLPVQSTVGDLNVSGVMVLLERAILAVKSSRFIKEVVVSTSEEIIANAATRLGCAVPRLRPLEFAGADVRINKVLQHELAEMEREGRFPDLFVSLEITHPFRPARLFDELIMRLLNTGVDTVIAGHAEFRPCWSKEGMSFRRLDEYLRHRQERDPLHVGLPALGCVSLPHVIRSGSRFGLQTGILELEDPMAMIEIRSRAAFENTFSVLDYQARSAN
jgi:rhamnosyltransferase